MGNKKVRIQENKTDFAEMKEMGQQEDLAFKPKKGAIQDISASEDEEEKEEEDIKESNDNDDMFGEEPFNSVIKKRVEIEGQEESGAIRYEGGVRIEPFNMKSELEEG